MRKVIEYVSCNPRHNITTDTDWILARNLWYAMGPSRPFRHMMPRSRPCTLTSFLPSFLSSNNNNLEWKPSLVKKALSTLPQSCHLDPFLLCILPRICAGVLEKDFFLTKGWPVKRSFEVPEGVSLADLQEVELGIGILTDLQLTEDWGTRRYLRGWLGGGRPGRWCFERLYGGIIGIWLVSFYVWRYARIMLDWHIHNARCNQASYQCPIPFSQFSMTISQYFSRLLERKVFPHLIMTRNTAAQAMPIKAAEMKQFWYPRLLTHGVILINIISLCFIYVYHARSTMTLNSPISNRKRHCIPHQHHTRHRITTQLLITINKIINAYTDPARIRESQQVHGDYETEPMHVMRGTDTPED